MRNDFDVGVDLAKRLRRRLDLRPADVGGRVDDLPVEVRQVDRVVIREADLSDPRGGEVDGGRRAETPSADEKDGRILELLLAGGSKFRENDLSAVTLKFLG